MITLREMLLLTLAVSCGSAWWVRQYRHTQDLRAALAIIGGPTADSLHSNVPLWISHIIGNELPIECGFACLDDGINWPSSPEDAASMQRLAELEPGYGFSAEAYDLAEIHGNPSIHELWFSISTTTPQDWYKALDTLKNLRRLVVSRAFKSNWDGHFPTDSLEGLDHLEMLLLQDSQPLDDDDLAEIARHERLEVLGFCGLRATDAGLAHLASLKNLRSLSITGPGIDDHTLEFVAKLLRLESLCLDDTRITDEGLASLAPLTELRSLIIREARLTEAGLPALSAFRRLRRLTLDDNDIRKLDTLDPAALPELRNFSLMETPITDDQTADFGLSHPSCTVVAESEKPETAKLLEQIDSGDEFVSLDNLKPSGDQIEIIAGAECVRTLFDRHYLREADFETIASLPNLEGLWLGSDLTPGSVRRLGHLEKLRRLKLFNCRLGEDTAKELTKLNLTELNLNEVEVAPLAWQSIGQLAGLRSLELYETPIADADLTRLSGTPQLRTLYIHRASLTDTGAFAIARISSIEKLTVSETGISDTGLRKLVETHPDLLELDISRTSVSSAGLALLRSLKHLDTLTVDQRLLDTDGIAALKRCGALCRITVDFHDNPEMSGYEDAQAALEALQVELPQLESADFQ
jgi:Leucine-rich repeat (LRR) protein